MPKALLSVLLLLLTSSPAAAQTALGPCEDCALMLEGMPAVIYWSTRVAPIQEPGESLLIQGTIFRQDGQTPAAGVVLYVYHTDQQGTYSPAKDQGLGNRHGHLRGWMKTDASGRYEFRTIRPGSYPNSRTPQHIHPIVLEPDGQYYYLDDFLFDDDPFLTADERQRQEQRGGDGILKLVKDNKGTWIGHRNIVLGKNIPGYR